MRHVLTAAALLMPTLALAHAGDHGAPGIGSLIVHALLEPDHALLLAVTLGVSCAVWAISRRRG